VATCFAPSEGVRRVDIKLCLRRQYLGGGDSSQYSALKQINRSNVAKLEVAWIYPTGPGTFVFDPTVVDDVMYVLKQNNAIADADAARSDRIGVAARRPPLSCNWTP
jgi:hypothetical protein